LVSLGIGERQFGRIRFRVMLGLVGLALSILAIRLYVLQVSRHDEFKTKSESNFIQSRRIPHERGVMLDREGRVLVDNRPAHDVTVTPSFLPDARPRLTRVLAAAGAQRTAKEVLADVDVALARPTVEPVVVWKALEPSAQDVVARLLTDGNSGLELVPGADGTSNLLLYPLEFLSQSLVFRRLEELLDFPEGGVDDARRDAARARGLNRFVPIVVKQNLTWEAFARVSHSASLGELPGIDVVNSVVRRYREGTMASHVLGYMNEVTALELEQETLKKRDYKRGDYLGRRGLERTFEEILRGTDGLEKVVVDAKGRWLNDSRSKLLLGDERRVNPVPGKTLVLALDMDLQRAAEQSFRGVAGSVVAVEVATGSVLALASFPPFNPNTVSTRMTGADKRALDRDPLQPWINKALQQHYAPGSTFKIFTAIAGLLESRITPETHLPCPGFFSLGRTTWRCFNRGGHGPISLQKSVTVSCDSYYYRLGHMLGADTLTRRTREFGFGQRTGIPLDGEIPGILPDEAYFKRRFGAYTPGQVVNISIGQGDLTVTPLQLAMAISAVVNGGILYEPRLVLRSLNAQGGVLQEFPPRERGRIQLPERGMKEIMAGMGEVVKPGGTAGGLAYKDDPPGLGMWVRTGGVALGGKTGTAQVVKLSKDKAHVDASKVDYLERDHAWFEGFAPLEKPEIVVVTMTEHGGFGGSISAPVSASVMRAYFEKKGFVARPDKDAPPKRAAAVVAPVAAPPPEAAAVEGHD